MLEASQNVSSVVLTQYALPANNRSESERTLRKLGGAGSKSSARSTGRTALRSAAVKEAFVDGNPTRFHPPYNCVVV